MIYGTLDIKGSTGQAGTSAISKIDENHYVGLITASSMNLRNEDTVKIKWNLGSITIPEKTGRDKRGNGILLLH